MPERFAVTLPTPTKDKHGRTIEVVWRTKREMRPPVTNVNRESERTRRLCQMLRVAERRMRHYGRTRKDNFIFEGGRPLLASDYHIEVKRILMLLGFHEQVGAMEAQRKSRAVKVVESV